MACRSKGVQQAFFKETKGLVSAIEEMGNPFMEDSDQLFTLDTKDVADQAVVKTVETIETLDMEQYVSFTNEHLIDRKSSLSEPIKKNKLALFSSPPPKVVSKAKHQLRSLKNDCALFSRLYIACHLLHLYPPLECFVSLETNQI